MPERFDVISFGGIVRDITFYTGAGRILRTPQNLMEQRMIAFEFGAKIPLTDAYFTLGGGAANSAYVFCQLGFSAAPVARVGNDEMGENIRYECMEKTLSTSFLQKDKEMRTGLSFILCANKKEHEHVAFTYRGANESLDISSALKKNILCKWFYITSLSEKEWLRDLLALTQYAKSHGIQIAWNPGNLQIQAGKKVLERILRAIDILILNKDEAIELVLSGVKIGKRNPRFLNKTLYLLNILNEWGPKIVLITEGAKGASALYQGKIYKVKSVKKKAINTTGVGDAFGATFVGSIMRNRSDIRSALLSAAENSASVVTKIGAQGGVLTRAELAQKMQHRQS